MTDVAVLQMGVVPLKRWYDVFTVLLPRFLSDPRTTADKIMHDRSFAASHSSPLHC